MQKYSIFSLIKNAFSNHEKWDLAWKDPNPKSEYDAVIIGGGGHGLATAYYLAKEHKITNMRFSYSRKDYITCLSLSEQILQQDKTNINALLFNARSNKKLKNPKFIYNVTIPTKFMYFMVRILSKKNLHKLLLKNSEPSQMPRET